MMCDKIPRGGDQVTKTGEQSIQGELKQCRVGVPTGA